LKFTELHSATQFFRESKDPEAFKYIYNFLSGKLYYLCLRYLKNDADAQDVLQETFVTAYRKIDSYTGNGSFEGWIKRIAVNNCLQKLKIDQKNFAFNYEIKENDELVEDDECVLEKEKSESQLLEAMKQLPDGYRTILNLSILEDYSHKEIGLLLHITESTSRSQLSRAKIALKEKLKGL
jgi:RNA polymerase sigma factor (sigma-70 family)